MTMVSPRVYADLSTLVVIDAAAGGDADGVVCAKTGIDSDAENNKINTMKIGL